MHGPPLDYKHLAFFEDMRCIPAEHESAVKRVIWNLTIGLAEIRADESAYLARVMAIVGLKQLIWKYLSVAKPVELEVEVVTPPTSEYTRCTCTGMLAGTSEWATKEVPTHQAESVVLGVAAGSRVTSLDVASFGCKRVYQMCVEEVGADGIVAATLLPWNHYGTSSGCHSVPSTPATIAVETTATRFKVSVRHTHHGIGAYPGVAIFRATGVAPPHILLQIGRRAIVTRLAAARAWAAPMVAQSELAFRRLVRALGVDVASTPMIKSHAFARSASYAATFDLPLDSRAAIAIATDGDTISVAGAGALDLNFDFLVAPDALLVVQLGGNDATVVERAAAVAVARGAVAIELNLGCPQKCAAKAHYGAFLLDEAELVASIVRAMRRSAGVDCAVLCKIRVRESYDATLSLCRVLVDSGCDAITVHARTKEEKRSSLHLARWEWIERLVRDLDPTPVIANGNVRCGGDAKRCLESTGANGVMSATGLLRNPALFSGARRTRLQLACAYLHFAQRYPPPPSTVALHVQHLVKGTLLLSPLLARHGDFEALLSQLRRKQRSEVTDAAVQIMLLGFTAASVDEELAASLKGTAASVDVKSAWYPDFSSDVWH